MTDQFIFFTAISIISDIIDQGTDDEIQAGFYKVVGMIALVQQLDSIYANSFLYLTKPSGNLKPLKNVVKQLCETK